MRPIHNLVGQMGFGVHGRIFMVAGGLSPSVIKVCVDEEPYQRERDDEGAGMKLAGDVAVNQIDRPAAAPFALFQKI